MSCHDDIIKWKHFPRNWPFVRGIHRSRWIPHTKASDAGLWCFCLICVWINGWVNNREAGDLRRYRGHYDVIVMFLRLQKHHIPMALAHPLHPIKSRSRNKRRHLWVGWYVSSWQPWFWPVHSIYYIHTTYYSRILTNQNILFLRDIHTKSWYGHADVLDDFILPGFRCVFSCMFQYSLCHGMPIGTSDIVHWSAAPHKRIANRTVFWV